MKKAKWIVVFLLFSLVTIGVTFFFTHCLFKQSFNIETTDWLSAILSWLSVSSAIFIGLIAFWQNERFKEESDKSAQKSEDYQKDLLEINNRLMQIEENKECAHIAFLQEVVTVTNAEEYKPPSNRKIFTAGISNAGRDFNNSTVFCFGITNQTDIPIKCFELTKFRVSYCNYEIDKNVEVLSYSKGGFVPSPIISRGEAVNFVLVANDLYNLAEKLPKGYEINIVVTVEVTSIFNRTVEQRFLLRLQKSNALFKSKSINYFWNYCFESESRIIQR